MTDSKEEGLTISVEREDLEDGSITYHLWDTTNGDYKWIVGLNDDKLAQGGKSKFYAERIALAVNTLSASSPVIPEGISGGDGWIAWEGGDDPLPPKTRVEVRLRCDQYTIGPAVSFWWGRDDTDRTYDIVAYRLANPV